MFGLRLLPSLLLLFAACGTDQVCGSGSWKPGRVAIHHLPLGQADATLVVAPAGRTLLVDAGETAWDRRAGAEAVARALDRILGCRKLDTAVITHFHLDHVGAPENGGLAALVATQGVSIAATFHRDLWRFRGAEGGTVARWREFLASPAARVLHPRIVDTSASVDLGPEVTVRVVAVDGAGTLLEAPHDGATNENDHSVALHLRFGRLDYFIGGDLSGAYVPGSNATSHDIETAVGRHLPDMDVYRVNHHGSNRSSNATFLAQIDPEVSIISVGAPNPHGHPGAMTVDRLLSTGAVYLTSPRLPRRDLGPAVVAGAEIVVTSADGETYEVSGVTGVAGLAHPFTHRYQATDPPRIDADGDGYFQEADPDDQAAVVLPALVGGCDPLQQPCGH